MYARRQRCIASRIHRAHTNGGQNTVIFLPAHKFLEKLINIHLHGVSHSKTTKFPAQIVKVQSRARISLRFGSRDKQTLYGMLGRRRRYCSSFSVCRCVQMLSKRREIQIHSRWERRTASNSI